MKHARVEKLYRPATVEKYQKKITLLGFRRYDVTFFLNVRLLASIFLFFMLLYIVEWGYLIAPIVVVCYYALFPKLTIDQKLSSRKKQMDRESLVVFERLRYALQSGKSLYLSFDLISRDRNGLFEREIARMISEVRLGKEMSVALGDLIDRIPSDSVQGVLLSLKEGFVYGSDLSKVLSKEIERLEVLTIGCCEKKLRTKKQRAWSLSIFFLLLIGLILGLSPVVIKYWIR